MDNFFERVATAAESGLYCFALAGALVIPDLCGALESPDGEAKGSRYIAWFDGHVAHAATGGTPVLDGQTCYRFRCSFLHQGTSISASGWPGTEDNCPPHRVSG
jgi:prepilin-type processing-associated H-X9-DG protein